VIRPLKMASLKNVSLAPVPRERVIDGVGNAGKNPLRHGNTGGPAVSQGHRVGQPHLVPQRKADPSGLQGCLMRTPKVEGDVECEI
jgi:hypothetical protein